MKVSKKEVLQAIKKLEKNPSDKFRLGGEMVGVAIGATLGGLGGAAVATLSGATAIPVATTVASWVGITVVTATPIGWLVGGVVLGGALVYGVGRVIRSGAGAEVQRKELLIRLKQKVQDMEIRVKPTQPPDAEMRDFYGKLKEALILDLIAPSQAGDMTIAVSNGSMPLMEAFTLLEKLVLGHGPKS